MHGRDAHTTNMISIHSIFVGQPETITDQTGSWKSSIFRKAVFGPVEVGLRGIVGDQVTDVVNHEALSIITPLTVVEGPEAGMATTGSRPRKQRLHRNLFMGFSPCF
jgi:hypothetical protein